jgi:hypothetical protein
MQTSLAKPAPRIDAGIDLSIRLGQRYRHRDYAGKRVTGTASGISVDSEGELRVDLVLDAPIIIPARGDGDTEIRLWRQHVPAHELAPFDDREELIATLMQALQAEQEWRARNACGALDPEWDYQVMVAAKIDAAIVAAGGVA